MRDPSQRPPLAHEELLRAAMSDAERAPPGQSPAPSIDELAPHFPDYELLGLIGRGGMGAVYRARQRRLERDVAIKILPRELAADPEFGERFTREARALAALNHPHVLTVFDFGQADGLCFLVTEFVDGVNLRQLMELGGLSPAEALRIAPQICEALQYAHEKGVVHRDIKPENILIDTRGQVKIADFGLAKIARPGDPVGLTRSTAVFGTPHYMAPEQWRGSGTVDHRADIFSLGVVLYEMLTGQLPIGHFDPPSKSADVPRGLDDVVRRTLAQQPDNRYQHASDVKVDVETQAKSLGRMKRSADARADAEEAPLAIAPLIAAAAGIIGVVGVAAGIAMEARSSYAKYLEASSFTKYDDYMEAVVESVQKDGSMVPTTVPELPAAVEATERWSAAAFEVLVIGSGISLAILVVVLGFWSVRRVRMAQGGVRGMGLSVFMAWLVPLVILDCALAAPIASMRVSDTRNILVFIAIFVIGGLNIGFLVWETRRQRRQLENGVVPRGRGVGYQFGIGLALLGLVGAVTTALLLPKERVGVEITIGPTAPVDLVGRDRAFVLSRLGPPDAMMCSATSQDWGYRAPKGEVVERALTFANGEVIAATREAVALLPNELPAEGPYPGQSFAELVQQIGTPTAHAVGTSATIFEFPGGLRVTVSDGIVVGSQRDR